MTPGGDMAERTVLALVRDSYGRHRTLIARLTFELIIIFVGVTCAFALENMRQRAADAEYRRSMIAALVPTLDNVLRHNAEFDREVDTKLSAFDAAIARDERPLIPVFRETGGERPPTRAWDGIVSTGVARALEPATYFELAAFYSRQESVGERYIRYNDFTEQHVFTLGRDHADAYDASGKLKPEFAAHVDRLRDLQTVNRQLTTQAEDLKLRLAPQYRE